MPNVVVFGQENPYGAVNPPVTGEPTQRVLQSITFNGESRQNESLENPMYFDEKGGTSPRSRGTTQQLTGSPSSAAFFTRITALGSNYRLPDGTDCRAQSQQNYPLPGTTTRVFGNSGVSRPTYSITTVESPRSRSEPSNGRFLRTVYGRCDTDKRQRRNTNPTSTLHSHASSGRGAQVTETDLNGTLCLPVTQSLSQSSLERPLSFNTVTDSLANRVTVVKYNTVSGHCEREALSVSIPNSLSRTFEFEDAEDRARLVSQRGSESSSLRLCYSVKDSREEPLVFSSTSSVTTESVALAGTTNAAWSEKRSCNTSDLSLQQPSESSIGNTMHLSLRMRENALQPQPPTTFRAAKRSPSLLSPTWTSEASASLESSDSACPVTSSPATARHHRHRKYMSQAAKLRRMRAVSYCRAVQIMLNLLDRTEPLDSGPMDEPLPYSETVTSDSATKLKRRQLTTAETDALAAFRERLLESGSDEFVPSRLDGTLTPRLISPLCNRPSACTQDGSPSISYWSDSDAEESYHIIEQEALTPRLVLGHQQRHLRPSGPNPGTCFKQKDFALYLNVLIYVFGCQTIFQILANVVTCTSSIFCTAPVSVALRRSYIVYEFFTTFLGEGDCFFLPSARPISCYKAFFPHHDLGRVPTNLRASPTVSSRDFGPSFLSPTHDCMEDELTRELYGDDPLHEFDRMPFWSVSPRLLTAASSNVLEPQEPLSLPVPSIPNDRTSETFRSTNVKQEYFDITPEGLSQKKVSDVQEAEDDKQQPGSAEDGTHVFRTSRSAKARSSRSAAPSLDALDLQAPEEEEPPPSAASIAASLDILARVIIAEYRLPALRLLQLRQFAQHARRPRGHRCHSRESFKRVAARATEHMHSGVSNVQHRVTHPSARLEKKYHMSSQFVIDPESSFEFPPPSPRRRTQETVSDPFRAQNNRERLARKLPVTLMQCFLEERYRFMGTLIRGLSKIAAGDARLDHGRKHTFHICRLLDLLFGTCECPAFTDFLLQGNLLHHLTSAIHLPGVIDFVLRVICVGTTANHATPNTFLQGLMSTKWDAVFAGALLPSNKTLIVSRRLAKLHMRFLSFIARRFLRFAYLGPLFLRYCKVLCIAQSRYTSQSTANFVVNSRHGKHEQARSDGFHRGSSKCAVRCFAHVIDAVRAALRYTAETLAVNRGRSITSIWQGCEPCFIVTDATKSLVELLSLDMNEKIRAEVEPTDVLLAVMLQKLLSQHVGDEPSHGFFGTLSHFCAWTAVSSDLRSISCLISFLMLKAAYHAQNLGFSGNATINFTAHRGRRRSLPTLIVKDRHCKPRRRCASLESVAASLSHPGSSLWERVAQYAGNEIRAVAAHESPLPRSISPPVSKHLPSVLLPARPSSSKLSLASPRLVPNNSDTQVKTQCSSQISTDSAVPRPESLSRSSTGKHDVSKEALGEARTDFFQNCGRSHGTVKKRKQQKTTLLTQMLFLFNFPTAPKTFEKELETLILFFSRHALALFLKMEYPVESAITTLPPTMQSLPVLAEQETSEALAACRNLRAGYTAGFKGMKIPHAVDIAAESSLAPLDVASDHKGKEPVSTITAASIANTVDKRESKSYPGRSTFLEGSLESRDALSSSRPIIWRPTITSWPSMPLHIAPPPFPAIAELGIRLLEMSLRSEFANVTILTRKTTQGIDASILLRTREGKRVSTFDLFNTAETQTEDTVDDLSSGSFAAENENNYVHPKRQIIMLPPWNYPTVYDTWIVPPDEVLNEIVPPDSVSTMGSGQVLEPLLELLLYIFGRTNIHLAALYAVSSGTNRERESAVQLIRAILLNTYPRRPLWRFLLFLTFFLDQFLPLLNDVLMSMLPSPPPADKNAAKECLTPQLLDVLEIIKMLVELDPCRAISLITPDVWKVLGDWLLWLPDSSIFAARVYAIYQVLLDFGHEKLISIGLLEHAFLDRLVRRLRDSFFTADGNVSLHSTVKPKEPLGVLLDLGLTLLQISVPQLLSGDALTYTVVSADEPTDIYVKKSGSTSADSTDVDACTSAAYASTPGDNSSTDNVLETELDSSPPRDPNLEGTVQKDQSIDEMVPTYQQNVTGLSTTRTLFDSGSDVAEDQSTIPKEACTCPATLAGKACDTSDDDTVNISGTLSALPYPQKVGLDTSTGTPETPVYDAPQGSPSTDVDTICSIAEYHQDRETGSNLQSENTSTMNSDTASANSGGLLGPDDPVLWDCRFGFIAVQLSRMQAWQEVQPYLELAQVTGMATLDETRRMRESRKAAERRQQIERANARAATSAKASSPMSHYADNVVLYPHENTGSNTEGFYQRVEDDTTGKEVECGDDDKENVLEEVGRVSWLEMVTATSNDQEPPGTEQFENTCEIYPNIEATTETQNEAIVTKEHTPNRTVKSQPSLLDSIKLFAQGLNRVENAIDN